MYITPLNFTEVLDRFYNQEKYDILLLFVSSFDGNDNIIIREIVENANRIDRITGSRMCFYYFMDSTYDCFEMNEMVRWVRSVHDRSHLFANGADRTMRTADEICHHFGILRSHLPAFILIDKDRAKSPFIYSILDYNDFEAFLTPINILHSFLEDKECILNDYEIRKGRIISDYNEKRRRTVITQYDVDKRKTARLHWEKEIKRLETRKEIELSRGEDERANKREINIAEFKRKLADYPDLVVCGEDESVPYPQEELDALCFPREQLDDIEKTAIEKLNLSLNSHESLNIITLGYSSAIFRIAELIKTKDVRISRIIEKIRYEIHEHGFDVFISCKSQDYVQAHTLYRYLVSNGFKPFLADPSLKEIGINEYTAVIGEVIDVCQNMVVFATDVSYLETTYVSAEWHIFVNDINTGHKPNARIVNVLSSDIDIHALPSWLRDKQCFTTENYRKGLIHFLRNIDNSKLAQELIEQVQESSSYFRQVLSQLDASADDELNNQIQALSVDIKKHADYFCHLLNEQRNYISPKELKSLSRDIKTSIDCWESDTHKIVCQHKKEQEKEDAIQYLNMHSMHYCAPRHTDGRRAKSEIQPSESIAPSFSEREIQESFFPSSSDNHELGDCNSNENKSHSETKSCSTCESNLSIEVSNGDLYSPSEECAVLDYVDDGCLSEADEGYDQYDSCTFDSASQINDSVCTCGECFYDRGVGCAPQKRGHNISYEPYSWNKRKTQHLPHRSSLWSRIFSRQDKPQTVYSSVFAPSEVKRKQSMLVQVYLHLAEETEKVKSLAVEADRNAERRGYEPLEVKLKEGDNVEIELNINGGNLLYNDKKTVVWPGSFVKRAFNYIIPDNIDVSELSCSVNIFINGAIAGELMFLTSIVDYNPQQLNTKINVRPTRKLFISYSHKDIKSAEKIAKIHEALGIDVFFDKHRLKAGYIYSEEISKFIQTADTFVLCWSKNAAESDYVEKERQEALAMAYPQCKPREQARLRIHPYDIEPHTNPPADMIENYHFEEL